MILIYGARARRAPGERYAIYATMEVAVFRLISLAAIFSARVKGL